MQAEILCVGTELLLGFQVNDDAAAVGRALARLGISCYRHVTVGDNPARLEQAIRESSARADLVVTCGGLGPTVDDVTLETIARATGRRLRLDSRLLRTIRVRFRKAGIRMPQGNTRQAYLPEGARPFPNAHGTAHGFLLRTSERPARWLAALPGPPSELNPMLERHLVPALRRLTKGACPKRAPKVPGLRKKGLPQPEGWERKAGTFHSRTLKATGLTESEINARVRDLLGLEGAVTLGIYAKAGEVALRITARAGSPAAARRRMAGLERDLRRRLGTLIFGADEETLEGAAVRVLKRKRLTLAVAESITGGLIGHRVTRVPGASDVFVGGVAAYANALKEGLLGVPNTLLRRHGAVSAETARVMADGVRRLTGAKVGLSVTGIAGPTGGSKKKPVGLVYVGLSRNSGTLVRRYLFSGDRRTVQWKASQAALDLLRLHLTQTRHLSGPKGADPKRGVRCRVG